MKRLLIFLILPCLACSTSYNTLTTRKSSVQTQMPAQSPTHLLTSTPTSDIAWVCVENLNLRETPGAGAPIVTTLNQGTRVQVLHQTTHIDGGTWLHILAGNVTGWLNAKYICKEGIEMRIITVGSQKGGVGKTTSAINLAAALALAEKRILLIDLDPQGNVSRFLGIAPLSGAYQLLGAYIPALSALMRGDRGEHIRSLIRPSGREHLSILPGSPETATAQALILSGERDLNLIRRAVTEQFSSYDIVILDTAPSLGGILEMAYWAADDVLIPAACETSGIEGAKQTINTLKNLTARGWHGRLAGVIPTFYDGRTVERRESLKQLNELFGDLALSPIHEATAIRELPSNQLTIFEKAEVERNIYTRRAAGEFSALGKAILRRR